MGRECEEQLQRFFHVRKEIQFLMQYVYQQWEKDKDEQLYQFPKLAYIDTNKLAHTEEYQRLQNLSVKTFTNMTEHERKYAFLQIQKVHQTMKRIVHAVMEIIRKYSAS